MSSRLLFNSITAAATAALVTVAPVHAQRTALVSWSGRVDTLVRISMQGSGAHVTAFGSPDVGVGTLRVLHALPREEGAVGVQLSGGRGIVQIVQQPTAANDYTAIVTVSDHSGGVDQYELTANWHPAVSGIANGSVEETVPEGVGMLHFSGDVDKSTVVRWRGMRAIVVNAAGAAPRQVREQVAGVGLPRQDVTVRIVKHEGRGDVVVEQQPTSANGYTAIIRISDKDEGYGHYDFDVVYDRNP